MKQRYKSILTLLIFSLILITGNVNSQSYLNRNYDFPAYGSSEYFAQVGGGISFPFIETDFKNTANPGFNVHGSIVKLMSRFFAFSMQVQYNLFTNNKSTTTGTASLSVTTLTGNIMAGNFSEDYKIHAYGYAGLGMAFLSLSGEVENFTVTSNTRSIGIRGGGGAYYKLSDKIGMYFETGLDYNFNSGTARGYIPLKIGAIIFQ